MNGGLATGIGVTTGVGRGVGTGGGVSGTGGVSAGSRVGTGETVGISVGVRTGETCCLGRSPWGLKSQDSPTTNTTRDSSPNNVRIAPRVLFIA
jgi:hypothetical protein